MIPNGAMTAPRMVAGKRLPWTRFWVPSAGRISADRDRRGFLDDPADDFGRAANPDVKELRELLPQPCLVLSGQPGIGKTTEVESLRQNPSDWLEQDETLIAFSGRIITSEEMLRRETVESPRWKHAIASGGRIRLLIDAVDEALKRLVVLVPVLTHWLKDEPRDRVRVILVCRVAEWHLADGQALAALWNVDAASVVYELCPLRWKDAELAAEESHVNIEAFWRELVRHQVKGLAARPITLRLLLQEMQAGGKLPGSHQELFSRAIARLCEEDPERMRYVSQPRHNPQHLARVAARIAALMMVGGRNVIVRGEQQTAEGELSIEEIAAGRESTVGDTFEVTRELVQATLDTALFSFRGPDRYGFDHQTFAEHLAADYLRDCTPLQLRRLVCVSFDRQERVAPQLVEVAARIALTNEAWCDHLIATEPELLLRADASSLVERKERAVESLLARAAREEAFDDAGSGNFYHTLRHPRLAEQLRRYIHDPSQNTVVRRMAFRIAGDAEFIELEPDLWQRIEVRDDEFNSVCRALADITGLHARDRLLAALRGDLPDDSYYSLRGMAVSKLVPDMLPVRDVLPYLRPQPDESMLGRYQMVVSYQLPKQLVLEDVPRVLAAMEADHAADDSFCGWGDWLPARASSRLRI